MNKKKTTDGERYEVGLWPKTFVCVSLARTVIPYSVSACVLVRVASETHSEEFEKKGKGQTCASPYLPTTFGLCREK